MKYQSQYLRTSFYPSNAISSVKSEWRHWRCNNSLLIVLQLAKNLNLSAHTLEYGKKAKLYDTTDFRDDSVKRIIKKLSDIERAALPQEKLEEVWKGFFSPSDI